MQQDGGSHAHRQSLYRGYQRFAGASHGVNKTVPPAVRACPFHGLFRKSSRSLPRGESGALAMQQDHAHRVVGFRLFQRAGQRLVHIRGECILLFRTIDGKVQHTTVAFALNVTGDSVIFDAALYDEAQDRLKKSETAEFLGG